MVFVCATDIGQQRQARMREDTAIGTIVQNLGLHYLAAQSVQVHLFAVLPLYGLST